MGEYMGHRFNMAIRAALVVLLVAALCTYASLESAVLALDDTVQADPVVGALQDAKAEKTTAEVEKTNAKAGKKEAKTEKKIEKNVLKKQREMLKKQKETFSALQKKEQTCFACIGSGLSGMKKAYNSCSSGSCDGTKKDKFTRALSKIKRELVKAESFGEMLAPNKTSALLKDMSDVLKRLSEMDADFVKCASDQSKCNKDTFNAKALGLSTDFKPTQMSLTEQQELPIEAQMEIRASKRRELGESAHVVNELAQVSGTANLAYELLQRAIGMTPSPPATALGEGSFDATLMDKDCGPTDSEVAAWQYDSKKS